MFNINVDLDEGVVLFVWSKIGGIWKRIFKKRF